MPRRNTNAVRTTRTLTRSTHVIVDSRTGHTVQHGVKRDLAIIAETQNVLAGAYRYLVKPIHR